MWSVECSNCEKEIEKEDKKDIRTNIDGDPICEDCPYAEEPDYPVQGSIVARREAVDNKRHLQSLLPHLEEKIEEKGLSAISEELANMLTHITIEYEIDKVEGTYGDNYEINITNAY